MNKLLIIFLSLIIPLFSLANNEILFQKANKHYTEGHYESAIEIYDSLLNTNIESANIYYNLGNSYFKSKDVPKAILYFEKARKLEPNNADIIYNLELANTRIADKIEAVPEFFLKTAYIELRNTFNEKQWTIINVVFFIFFLVLIVVFFTTQKNRKLWFSFSLLFLTITFISGVIGFDSNKEIRTHNSAIIFTPTIDIKSAPDHKSNTIFILHQGTKVFLLERSSKWQKIRIANGSEGWLKVNNFEEI